MKRKHRVSIPFPNRLLIVLLTLPSAFLWTAGCGGGRSPLGESGRWDIFALSVRDLYDTSAEAFWREHGRMPASLQELQTSGWQWFDPVAPGYAPDFEMVQRPLSTWQEDLDHIELVFTQTGFDFAFHMRLGNMGGKPSLMTLDEPDAIARYEKNRSETQESYSVAGTDEDGIRHHVALSLETQFVRRYLAEYRRCPRSGDQLVRGMWEPRGDVLRKLPTVKAGEEGWFYVGLKPSGRGAILYMELVHLGGMPAVEQIAYDLEMRDGSMTVTESQVPADRQVKREDTFALVDSSLPGWGFPVSDPAE